MVSADREWTARIGEQSSALLSRGLRWRRSGGGLLLLFLVLEIAFQLANDYRPGIIATAVLFFVGSFCLFYALRFDARARRLVAHQLGLPPEQAKWVRVRHGVAEYDRWLAARGQPGWPATGWR